MRGKNLAQLIRTLSLLSRPMGATKKEMADDLEISVRSVSRMPKIALSLPEIISLCMLAGESVIFRGTDISRNIAAAIAKLMLFVPEDTQTELSALKRIFICKTMGSKTYAGKEDVIRTPRGSVD